MAMPMLLMARWRYRCCRRRGNGDADAANGDGVAMEMPMLLMASWRWQGGVAMTMPMMRIASWPCSSQD